jgi:hypothetical protein
MILAAMGVGLYYAVDNAVRRMVRWQPDTNPTDDNG